MALPATPETRRARGFANAMLFSVSLALGVPVSGATAADVIEFEPVAPPPVSAKALFVTDETSKTELFAFNADEPLPPASLTKIVAALVILDEVNFDDVVHIVEEDRVSTEESQVGLIAGDRVSARDLFVGMLVPSGNDATLALARHLGEARLGESATPDEAVDAFVDMMNVTARELGATASHFENPTGIDAEGHVMSARDIATVTAIALQNPLFAEIVSTQTATLGSEVLDGGYPVSTTNDLLLEGLVTGVKTGSTPKAGGCLVTTFAVGPNEVIAVILGSDALETTEGLRDYSVRFSDMRQVISATSSAYTWLDPAVDGAVSGLLEELSVWDATLDGGSLLPIPTELATQVKYRLILAPPPATAGPVGEIHFFVDEQLISRRPAFQAN